MKSFVLTFTKEQLERHLKYSKTNIFVTLDEKIADAGDITVIDSKIYVLRDVRVEPVHRNTLGGEFIATRSGFEGYSDYYDELVSIYGDVSKKEMFVYMLDRLYVRTEPMFEYEYRLNALEKEYLTLSRFVEDYLIEG